MRCLLLKILNNSVEIYLIIRRAELEKLKCNQIFGPVVVSAMVFKTSGPIISTLFQRKVINQLSPALSGRVRKKTTGTILISTWPNFNIDQIRELEELHNKTFFTRYIRNKDLTPRCTSGSILLAALVGNLGLWVSLG